MSDDSVVVMPKNYNNVLNAGRPKGSRNKATLVKDALSNVFSDLARTRLPEIIEVLANLAVEGNIQAAKVILDNMDKIVVNDIKQNENTGENIQVIINRNNVKIRHKGQELEVGGSQGDGGVEGSGTPIDQYYPEQFSDDSDDNSIIDYSDNHNSPINPKHFYKVGDEIVNLWEIAKDNKVDYHKLRYRLVDVGLTVDEALEELL